MTNARNDIVAGQPERKLSQPYTLQTASQETITILKQALVQLTLGLSTLKICVFVAKITKITDEFNLGLEVVRANDESENFRRYVSRLGQEKVSLWRPGARPLSSQPTLASDEIPARCERVMMV